jgi:GntR family transcriptional regulator, transcriptional repressor for pyruvate dehydrogenase complex
MRDQGTASAKDDITGRLIGIFKRLISEGSMAAGTRLPAERELAEKLGVSRSSLRQALKVLEIMGVISQRVGDGTYVNAGAPSLLGEPLDFLILLDGISFHELMEARLIVEPELAARAARRATREDIVALANVHATMELNKKDAAVLAEADLLFHQTISGIAGNRVCSTMFAAVHQSVHRQIAMTAKLAQPEHTLTMHRRILTAIRKGSAEEARQRMREHLDDANSLLTRAVAERSESRLLHRLSRLTVVAEPKPSLG